MSKAERLINFLHPIHQMIVGEHVISDLHLETLSSCVPLKTTWGLTEFQTQLKSPINDVSVIKRRQLPLMALRLNRPLTHSLAHDLSTIDTDIDAIDDVLNNTDPRITESVQQILWKPSHLGGVLNENTFAMNALIVWRTILIPLFTLIGPVLAIVIPFFLLRVIRPGLDITTDMYLDHVRNVLRQQINIPSFLREKHAGDRFGYVLESVFIALTLGMFMSGIWSQITSALHTRTIWFDLAERGQSIQRVYKVAKKAMTNLHSLGTRGIRACTTLLSEGQQVLDACAKLENLEGVPAFGFAWNHTDAMCLLKQWIARLDCTTAIACLENICFPQCMKNGASLTLRGVYHPGVRACIRNDFTSCHSILTGPNRGGKSTYCQSIGLAIVSAQTWGFAWAESMVWTPFSTILTALDSVGTLGELSTFEAEIEFAKSVLAVSELPAFVMMDEIFHSTNASDGEGASRVFMKQLYTRDGLLSLISTHYKDLATTFKDVATPLYMEAKTLENGRLSYSYKVAHGISDKSSVMEILRERGLLPESPLAVS
jgi:hypothetical protein